MSINLAKAEQLANDLRNCINQAIKIAEMNEDNQLINEIQEVLSSFNAEMEFIRSNPSEISDADLEYTSDLVQECLQDLSELNAS